jgi:hypothetical protein
VSSNFLPANLKLGGAFDFILDDYNKVSLNLEFAKLLVPTPQIPDAPVDTNGDGDFTDDEDITELEQRTQNNLEYREIGWTSGIFQSLEMRQTVSPKN